MKESTKEVKLSMENYEKFRSLDNIEKYFKALTRLVEKISSDVELQTILHSIYRRQNKDIALDNQENVRNGLEMLIWISFCH